jgi:hypothetical protein
MGLRPGDRFQVRDLVPAVRSRRLILPSTS